MTAPGELGSFARILVCYAVDTKEVAVSLCSIGPSLPV